MKMKIFERKLYLQILSELNERQFVILLGARQTGKSTILKQIGTFLDAKNEKNTMLSLEDFSILSKLDEHPDNLFLFVPKPQGDEKIVVLIDEIQYLQNPTNFLKLLYDKYSENLKIVATGSSAFYIDTKFKDSLAGRKQLFELSTLSFDEFLLFKTGTNKLSIELDEIRKNENYLSSRRKEIAVYLDEYLIYGGYPAVVLAETHEKKISILKELLLSFTKRDIEEANIQFPDKFYRLMMLLAEQTGNLLNTNELSTTIGLSTTSVNNYLYILQKCFHIRLLKPFFKNLRKELSKMPKIYFNDLGMRNILLGQFQIIETRLDKGELLENFLFLRLNELYSTDNLRYWRTSSGNEVDFIISQGNENSFAIECKFNVTNFNSKRYSIFTENYPQIPLSARSYSSEKNKHWIAAI